MLAVDEVRALGHASIGTEHELLGLLRCGNELVLQALSGITPEWVREQLGRGETKSTGQVPFTLGAKRALELAADEADALGHGLIGTEHVLLGLLASQDTATAILRDRGVAPEGVRAAVLRSIG